MTGGKHRGRQRLVRAGAHRLPRERVLPRLLAAGLPVDGRDHAGRTPLHHAVALGADGLVAALLAAGADPDAVDDFHRRRADYRAGSRPPFDLDVMRRTFLQRA